MEKEMEKKTEKKTEKETKKETKNTHQGSISGRHCSLAKILLLRPNSYADSKDWDDLVHAFTESLNRSPLDEMILLVRTDIPGPSERQPKCVRRVSYDELDEVPGLLRSVAPRVLRSGTTSVGTQRTPAETGTGVKPGGDRDRQARQKRVEMRK